MISDAKYVKEDYGAMDDFPLDMEDDSAIEFLNPAMRRKSVLDKLNNNYIIRQNSYFEYCRIINRKCIFAIMMLGIFIFFVVSFAGTIFFNQNFGIATYDFIIVGGGAAGSIITRKLVDAGARVLLVEAGGATQYDLGGKGYGQSPVTSLDIPFLWPALTDNSDTIWKELKDQMIYVGKGLGGSGVINSMVYMRALPEDVIGWNLSTITWNTMLKQYKALEAYQNLSKPNIDPLIAEYHGFTGPLATSDLCVSDLLAQSFFDTIQQHTDTTLLHDFNNPYTSRVGFGYYDFNIHCGVRDSAGKAFLSSYVLDPTQPTSKDKLTIELRSKVQRILLAKYNAMGAITGYGFDMSNEQETNANNNASTNNDHSQSSWAYGIEYYKDGELKTAKLGGNAFGVKGQHDFSGQRCIILTAGAIMTPKLLMNSGIGDKRELSAAGIDVNYHHPMLGKTLQDHPMTYLILNATPELFASYPHAFAMPKDWFNYFKTIDLIHNLTVSTTISSAERDTKIARLMKKLGILATPGFSFGGFLSSPYATLPTLPDLQITVFPTLDAFPQVVEVMSNLSGIVHPILITIALLQPEARRKIKLNPNNAMNSPPIVQPTDGTTVLTSMDIRRLTWGIHHMRSIFQLQPLRNQWSTELFPGKDLSEDALEQWIPDHLLSWHNYVGSVPMGSNPKESILDEQFRVRDIDALRVADASAIPIIPRGNVHSTVVAMASIAADMILQQGGFS